tara:strand:+ start:578 stop:964 length:387 start_codon:yes stop_codon:yes gene_type:complete
MPSDKYIKDLHDSARIYNIDSSAKDYLEEWESIEAIASERNEDMQRKIDNANSRYPTRPLPSWMDKEHLDEYGYDQELVECDNCDGRGWNTEREQFGFGDDPMIIACKKCGGYAVLRAKNGNGHGWTF